MMNSLAIQIAKEMAAPAKDRDHALDEDRSLAPIISLVPPPTPGWYEDPTSGGSRWWDGNAWGPMAD